MVVATALARGVGVGPVPRRFAARRSMGWDEVFLYGYTPKKIT